jgi:beta-galactosidase
MIGKITLASLGILAAALLQNAVAFAGDVPATDVRRDTRLDSGWRFAQGDVTNTESPQFDDKGWQAVSIPHCWGWEQAQKGDAKYYHGAGCYRRALDLVPEKGRRYFLRFEAASLVANVFLNGKPLGEHRGGFGAFCFEITHNLTASGKNLLAVRVSNEKFPDIAPLSGDFNVYGGLYRPVHLLETAAVCFTPTDHAAPGVAWQQSSVSAAQAVLEVTADISNGSAEGRPFTLYPGEKSKSGHFTLAAKVLDADGKTVAATEQDIVLSQHVTEPFHLRVVVDKPHLWNGLQDPYLYRAVVELRAADQIVDSIQQPLGLRSYRVDAEKGFFLNGRPYQLHGVCKHQDRADKGWAVSEADLAEDVSLLKEIGARAVRCAHYQHSDYFYSLCDRAGILVWAEIPQVDQIRSTPGFAETSRNQLLDLIRQNINHPSIFAWGLFNEVRPGSGDPHRELRDLAILAHGEDPARPTIAATSHATWPQMNKIPDLLGWNRYPGWYERFSDLQDAARWTRYQPSSRYGGVCFSEYGAGANPAQHEDNPQAPKPGGPWHPEEWQCLVHEAAWKQFNAHPFIWGTFVWNMFDFCVAGRHEGGSVARNDKGLVTFDRRLKKDAFYFYKANWSDEPVLYIASRRFTERTNAATDVKVYSNAQRAELFVNGVSQGMRDNDGNAVFVWQQVKLAGRANHIEARARRKGQSLNDKCDWTLKAK